MNIWLLCGFLFWMNPATGQRVTYLEVRPPPDSVVFVFTSADGTNWVPRWEVIYEARDPHVYCPLEGLGDHAMIKFTVFCRQ